MSTACPGGCTGTSRAPLRQTRDGRFAARGTLLCTTWTSLSGGKRQTVKLLGSSSQWRKGSSSGSRLTAVVVPVRAGSFIAVAIALVAGLAAWASSSENYPAHPGTSWERTGAHLANRPDIHCEHDAQGHRARDPKVPRTRCKGRI